MEPVPVDPILKSTLLKAAGPLVGILLVLFLTKKRGISWSNDLGLVKPAIWALALWIVVWVGWMAFDEWLIARLDLDQAKPWPDLPPLVVALRILTIGILGPISEELVVRGFFLHILRRTRLGVIGAILVTSLAWGVVHSYGLGAIALIVGDGILLGAARVYGRSLYIPIAMHVIGNLFSIYQSLTA